jgi:ABC-type nitrate/sulfonate/bicarbonate transport system substrate-binding protein
VPIPLYVPYPTLTFAQIFVGEETGILRRHAPEVAVAVGGHETYLEILAGEGEGIISILHMGLRAYDRGHEFRIVTTVFHEVVHRLVSRPAIPAIPALRGRTVMVNAFQGASDLETRYVMRKAGLSPDDVRFVEAGPDLETAQLEALRAGTVDAIASSAPFWYVAQKEGYRVLGDVGTFYANWVPTALVARADWAASHRDLVHRLRAAFDEVAQFVRDRPRDVERIMLARVPEFTPEDGPALIEHLMSAWDPRHRMAGLSNYIQAYCSEFQMRQPTVDSLWAI